MYKDTNLRAINKNRFDNLKQDLTATLKRNLGLRVREHPSVAAIIEGRYYLCNAENELIDHFDIRIAVPKGYPFVFPVMCETSNKIRRDKDWHTDEKGLTCVEISHFTNIIAKRGISVYDFIEYYVRKFFSWQLVKEFEGDKNLTEWAHDEPGNIQFYEWLFGSTNRELIKTFISSVLNKSTPGRNDLCICGSGHKSKFCHEEIFPYLKDINREQLIKDLKLFEK